MWWRGTGDDSSRAAGVILVLLVRAAVFGSVFFALPPWGELPPRWQVAVAFPALALLCYGRGVLARGVAVLAALEAIPTLWLSLKCTDLLVRTVGVAR